jgi:transposase
MTKGRADNDAQDVGGRSAALGGRMLRSYAVGAMPIINRVLERIELERLLGEHLPPDGPRVQVPTSAALSVLVRNLMFSREPVYGIGEWADRYPPGLVGLASAAGEALSDDRLGRCLDRLFASGQHELVLEVVRHVIQEFGVRLDELHNDSTTISFFGAYAEAGQEGIQRGRPTPAITYGHSKARRPDLKQLLYILTLSEDGGVPIYFSTKSGNTSDDTTHQQTWDLLCELTGRKDFLYVADCKLATMDNMRYIDQREGRFISVLPASRKEDNDFRRRLLETPEPMGWKHLCDRTADDGELADSVSIWPRETLTADGYRLWWFHSTRKAEWDQRSRLRKIDRAVGELTDLRRRLRGPRTRFRQPQQVQQAVREVLDTNDVRPWLRASILQWKSDEYRQTKRGRPGSETKYVKHETLSFDLEWEIDAQALEKVQAGDGVFPLITNVREFSALQTLETHQRQSVIEKRFSQLKTDFQVAPIYLKNVSRIQALLCAYFFAMLTQALVERELRRAMEKAELESLPLYPEGRPCKRPTTRRLIDVFEPIQRHILTGEGSLDTFVTNLSPLHQQLLQLMNLPSQSYGQ